MKKKHLLFLTAAAVLIFVAAGAAMAMDHKININTATVKELTQLDGVGDAIAKRIVEYRENAGPFKEPRDLMKVKGIGEKTFEKNKDKITVGKPEAPAKKTEKKQ